ncbi:uncharacterized protein METZ01_LOCUS246774, partial [marine metagenome]
YGGVFVFDQTTQPTLVISESNTWYSTLGVEIMGYDEIHFKEEGDIVARDYFDYKDFQFSNGWKPVYQENYTDTLYDYTIIIPGVEDHSTLLTDLDAYYSLDGDGTDSNGSNDLTVTGVTFDSSDTASGSSHSASFDGIDDNLKIANSFEYTTSFSTSCWIRGESDMDDNARILDNNYPDGASAVRGWRIHKTGGTNSITFSLWGNGTGANSGSYNVLVGNVITDVDNPTLTFDGNTWHHIVCTYTSGDGEAKIYIDGTEAKSYTTHGTLEYTNVDTFSIGARTLNPSHGASTFPEPWKGLIDEIGIWDKALTATEVKDLYNFSSFNNDGNGMSYEEGSVVYTYDNRYAFLNLIFDERVQRAVIDSGEYGTQKITKLTDDLLPGLEDQYWLIESQIVKRDYFVQNDFQFINNMMQPVQQENYTHTYYDTYVNNISPEGFVLDERVQKTIIDDID